MQKAIGKICIANHMEQFKSWNKPEDDPPFEWRRGTKIEKGNWVVQNVSLHACNYNLPLPLSFHIIHHLPTTFTHMPLWQTCVTGLAVAYSMHFH
jgi:hypothetical protein